MTKTTVSTAGGAIRKIDRAKLMARAWAIFRQTYCYPQIKFSDIGRKCFAWALRQAWVEAREAARLAALSPVAKVERIETLECLIARAGYIDSARRGKQPFGLTAPNCASCKRPRPRRCVTPCWARVA
jgi:hypothetical protein